MMTLPTKRTLAEHNDMIVKASRLVEQVKALDDSTRAEFIDQLCGEVCVYCGNNSLPCYCMRDD